MKFFVKLFVLLGTLSVSPFAFAAEIKIAMVDMTTAQRNLIAMEDINNKLKNIQEGIQKDLTNKEQELRNKTTALQEKRSVLASSAIRDQELNIEKGIYALQKEVEIQNGLMDRVRFASIGELDEKMKDVVAKVAKKMGYNMVLSSNLFLYTENGVFGDLTADSVRVMNEEVKNVDVDGYYTKFKKEMTGGISSSDATDGKGGGKKKGGKKK